MLAPVTTTMPALYFNWNKMHWKAQKTASRAILEYMPVHARTNNSGWGKTTCGESSKPHTGINLRKHHV
jgi:hypothetical protein